MIGLRSDLGGVGGGGRRRDLSQKDWRAGGRRRDERGRRALGQPSRVEWAKGKGGATTASLVDKDVATKVRLAPASLSTLSTPDFDPPSSLELAR